MTGPEALLRRAAVVFVCALVIVFCIYAIAYIFNLITPVPGPPPP